MGVVAGGGRGGGGGGAKVPVGSLWSAVFKESNARNRPRCSIKNFGDEANHASSCSPRFLPLNSSIDSLKTEKAKAGPDGHLPQPSQQPIC